MKLSEYSYCLPDCLIANMPPIVRGTSRLLVLDRKTGSLTDRRYSDIVDYLDTGDTIILNDTKVIKARLMSVKQNGAKRELVLLERHSSDEDWRCHKVLYRRKLSKGDILSVGPAKLTVEQIHGDGVATVRCDHNLLELATGYGEVPLPPYIHRKAEPQDAIRYQTTWAKESGSVAAPTASLNMTDDILTTLKQKGVNVIYITLHVGLGTFLPIRADSIEEHTMHKEYFEISKHAIDVIKTTKLQKKRIVALGTTVARTLEHAYDLIQKSNTDIKGEADIFIYHGYKFKLIDVLITNYHAPKSTVLMLASAFAGWDRLLPAYQYAIDNNYQFLSYGDSMLIL